ncbi:general secretion pathway protein I [Luteibacter rhizovicinus]|uniref:General secretion pathway protein I n=1 Tax=Luteibacter rhizovicinus TaxID=242606 RepID=A0A4R3YIS3_9GAMM|nr:prepilin-type N-terminal cleavage/methylation domain-containing protein [Luteibacter rhizovicinus]TCV92011.1 general secretion pathway protein I [Luteibacter rhizovicinus]
MNVPRFRAARGFSLLEVIAAIAILAIAFAALMQVAGSSMSLTARAGERTQAALRARSMLDSAFVMEPLREGSSEGRFDDTYRWRMTVTPWQAAASGNGVPQDASRRLYRLDLDVLWGGDNNERSARFSTLRMGAPPPGGLP